MPSTRFETEQNFIDWNEEMAHKYDPEAYHLRSNFLIRWIERRRVKAILRFLAVRPTDRVLEVGCGAGNVLEQVGSGRLHGLDLSTYLLQKARRRLAGCKAGLVRGNAEQLPFAGGRFDKLVCTEVLEHVADPRRVVNEMARLAAADGLVVISVPNEAWIDRAKALIRRLGLWRWLLQGEEGAYTSSEQMTDEWHLHRFDLALLQQVAAGILEIRRVRAIPFPYIPLRYVVCCRVIAEKHRRGGEFSA